MSCLKTVYTKLLTPPKDLDLILLSATKDITRTTQQLSITLPNEMASLVKAKVAGGAYAAESEVIREGSVAQLSHSANLRLQNLIKARDK